MLTYGPVNPITDETEHVSLPSEALSTYRDILEDYFVDAKMAKGWYLAV